MGQFVFNQAKGKFTEWAARVNANDPANSILILSVWSTSTADATLQDLDTVAAVEADSGTNELTTNGWGRKTFADGTITVTIDDTNNRTAVDVADQTWTGVTSGTSTDVGFSYDSDSTTGTDANVVPATWHDFAITPDGSDVTATIADLFWAS